MNLSTLTLSSFRNYHKRTFSFSSKTTLFVGPNTIGKTNILEAIYLLATGKSFRANQESDMISFEKEIGRVKGVTDSNGEVDLEIILTRGMVAGQKAQTKKYLVNQIPRRMIDFLGNLRAVLFWPEDLDLITDSPSLRRKYMDLILVQVDREYRRSLLSYEKGVRQRNKLLERIRDEGVSRYQLLFWNQLLIKNGNYITHKRRELFDFINHDEKLFGPMEIIYDSSIISEPRLLQYTEQEISSATTLVGPHRDDFQILKNDYDMSSFGSRGEQRLGVLWLKLCELDFITEKTKQRPLLLLDDIFSELDDSHREQILKIIPKQQTIITTADIHSIDKKYFDTMEVVELG
jgi:DNA replication and repair protein RecF